MNNKVVIALVLGALCVSAHVLEAHAGDEIPDWKKIHDNLAPGLLGGHKLLDAEWKPGHMSKLIAGRKLLEAGRPDPAEEVGRNIISRKLLEAGRPGPMGTPMIAGRKLLFDFNWDCHCHNAVP